MIEEMIIKEKEKKLTYNSLQQFKREQDRLIAEGKIQKPQIVYDIFTPEEQTEFDRSITWETIFGNTLNNLPKQ